MEDANARVSGWREDAELLVSFLEGFVRERQVVLASSPYLTSRRFYDLCLQHDVRTARDLRIARGEDVITKLLAKNKEEAALFAQNLHTAAQPFVLNPTAFVVDPAKTGRKWTHREYGDFWNLVIANKCRTLYFNEGWQFSNSCTSAYLSGLKVGAKLFDHAKNTLGLDTAKKLIRGATVRLEDYGFDVANLQGVFGEIRSFAGLG